MVLNFSIKRRRNTFACFLSICPRSHSFALICDPFNGFARFNLGRPFFSKSWVLLFRFSVVLFLHPAELSYFSFFLPPQEFGKQATLLPLPTWQYISELNFLPKIPILLSILQNLFQQNLILLLFHRNC